MKYIVSLTREFIVDANSKDEAAKKTSEEWSLYSSDDISDDVRLYACAMNVIELNEQTIYKIRQQNETYVM